MELVTDQTSSQEVHYVKGQTSSLHHSNDRNLKSSPWHSNFSHFSQHPYKICFIFSLLLNIFLILSIVPTRSLFLVGLSNTITQVLKPDHNDHQCQYGKFYIYDMPKKFNTQILKNCELIHNPALTNRCDTLLNNGFGREAPGMDKIIPANLTYNAWYWTDQFNLEPIFHKRMIHHKCRTLDAEAAAAFYIPFYVGLEAERVLWTDMGLREKDRFCMKMLSWVDHNYPYLKKSKGLNHFIAVGRLSTEFRREIDEGWQWGTKCIILLSRKNITRLIVERLVSDDLDVGIPHPSGFHPSTPLEVVSWQKFVLSRTRNALMSYTGGPRNWLPIRAILAAQCQSVGPAVCRTVDCSGRKCSDGSNAVLEVFLDSDFCLQPRGDTFTRKSTLDCMTAGSIPVFFWNETAYLQYPWFLPDDPKSYSVFINHDEVVQNGTSIKDVLEKISKEEVKRMREKVAETIPKIIYAKPNEGLGSMKDAVDIAVDGILKRISKSQR